MAAAIVDHVVFLVRLYIVHMRQRVLCDFVPKSYVVLSPASLNFCASKVKALRFHDGLTVHLLRTSCEEFFELRQLRSTQT